MHKAIKLNETCYEYRGFHIFVNEDETQYNLTCGGEDCGNWSSLDAATEQADYIIDLPSYV